MSSGPDAEADADAIRNKRLARLQQRPVPAPQDSPSSSTPLPPNNDASSSEVAKPQPRPESRLLSSVATTPSPRSTDAPATLKRAAPDSREGNRAAPAALIKPQTHESGLTPQEAWEDQRLGQIFGVALRPNPRAVSAGFLVLENLRKDLEDEMPADQKSKKAARLSVGMLDQLILSICGEKGIVPIDHLIGSWRRAMDIQRKTPASRLDAQKIAVLSEVRRICVNFVLCCITVPDMFGGAQPPVRLDQRLLADPDIDQGLPQEVLIDLLSKLDEEPDLVESFQNAFRMLSATLGKMHMSDNYKPYMHALGRIATLKPLAEMFVNLPEFLSDAAPRELEHAMLMGPFFRISPVQAETSKQYFSNAKSKSATVLRDTTNTLRMASKALQEELAQIVTALCKTSEQVRSRVLDFFAMVINANKKRTAINVNHSTVASDGFMINVTAVLSRLCEPFMDSSFSKISRIDVNYFHRSPKLNIEDETKLNADDQSSKEFYSHPAEGKNSFITEIFFLTVAAYHYGLVATETEHEGLSRDIPEMEKHLVRIEADRQKYIGQSAALAVLDRNIAKIKDRLDDAIAYRLALEVILLDSNVQASALLFMRYQMVWLLKLVDGTHQYPHQVLSLPLPDPPPAVFNHLPEYVVESVGHIISFVSMYTPDVLISTQLTDLLIFAVTFLRSSAYIQKATLKSRLVEIIFWGIRPGRGGTGYLAELIHGNTFVKQHLMRAMMNFYIEIEKHYYEKFTVRYHISKIIQQIWPNQAYRKMLEQESDHNLDFFVRFVALLLNDVTYVLDNSLTALADIRRLQDDLEVNPGTWTDEEKADKEKALAKAERDAQSYMQLGNETVIMVNLFTSTIGDSFVQPEIVSRLAGMLDYNLEALVGPKCNNLRVRNPEKYRFNPKALLGEITSIYINLCQKAPFVEAIARDGRSYKPKTFQDALAVLAKHHLKSSEDIAALAKLAQDVKVIKERDDAEELELGDIPDDFMDPLMATLMEDPVILPLSGTRIDRQTIKAHLLSDATDPFNRSPLKIEDVTPDVELKTRIDAWIQERREAVRAERDKDAAITITGEDEMDIDKEL